MFLVLVCFFLQLSLFSYLDWVVRKRQLQLEVLFLSASLDVLDEVADSVFWLCEGLVVGRSMAVPFNYLVAGANLTIVVSDSIVLLSAFLLCVSV